MDVYKSYYSKLIDTLPMDDVTFFGQLYSQDLLPGDLKAKVKSQTTQAEKASYFLDNAIEPSLRTGNNKEAIESLVSIMAKYSDPACKKLANEMSGELRLHIHAHNAVNHCMFKTLDVGMQTHSLSNA